MSQSARTEELLGRLAGNGAVTGRLGTGRVTIVADPGDLTDPQTQYVLTFSVNLLARLFPVVKELSVAVPSEIPLVARLPRWGASGLSGSLEQFLRALAPPVRWQVQPVDSTRQSDVVLAIGDATLPADVYVGSEGWIAQVSGTEALTIHGPPNPIGAFAAATFGVAEVWKRLLMRIRDELPRLPIVPTTETITFSTFDYRHDDCSPNPRLPEEVDVGRVTFVGLGTGGIAAAWTLASMRRLTGHATLIEPDEVTDTNLNRLVAAGAGDARALRPKVDVTAALLESHEGCEVQLHRASIDETVNTLGSDDLGRVVAAVHSRAARRTIQLETPEVLWDAAATETGEFFVWRVDFGRTPCLACRFRDGEADPERQKSKQLFQLLGFTPEFWHERLRDNAVFTAAEVSAIAKRLREDSSDASAPGVGQRFGDWEAEQCGKIRLPDPDDEIPIPFAPVMAGILLAGEVVKEAAFPRARLHSTYWNTLVGRFVPSNQPRNPSPRRDCPVCGNEAIRQQYERRWSPSAGHVGGAAIGSAPTRRDATPE